MDNSKFKGNKTIETERLILRKLAAGDTYAIFEFASNPVVPKYMLWDHHTTVQSTINFVNFILDQYEFDNAGEWVLTLKGSGKVIGTIGLSSLTKYLSVEMGFTLHPDFWGNGYMPEAAAGVIRYAFEEMKLNRVESQHFVENRQCERVLNKIGMTFEGVLRERVFAKDRYWDCAMYSILAKDYFRLCHSGQREESKYICREEK